MIRVNMRRYVVVKIGTVPIATELVKCEELLPTEISMSRVEAQVFTDKLAALRHNRSQSAQFFSATIRGDEPNEIYVVAVSLHQAQLALVNYLMGPVKWTKKEQDTEYIAALEAEAAKKQDADQP